MVLSSITLSLYGMSKLNSQLQRPLGRITDLTISLHMVSLQVVAAVVFITYTWKYSSLVDVLDTLEVVYRDLQLRTSEVKATVKFWAVCAVAATLVTIVENLTPLAHGGVTVGRLLIFATFLIPMLLLFCSQVAVLVQFTYVVQSIARAFRTVNARIEEEINSHEIERSGINRGIPDVGTTHATTDAPLPRPPIRRLYYDAGMKGMHTVVQSERFHVVLGLTMRSNLLAMMRSSLLIM
ncbi:hypothetical protein J6590_065591 [Homalodisca vitripennis]|nr:hypothetical protein J6590_065591 [Homalodisca vitripennis]